MKLIVLLMACAALSGCSTFLMKKCEQQGNSDYYHCKQAKLVF